MDSQCVSYIFLLHFFFVGGVVNPSQAIQHRSMALSTVDSRHMTKLVKFEGISLNSQMGRLSSEVWARPSQLEPG